MKKKLFLWLLIIMAVMSMVGCGSSKSSESAVPVAANQVISNEYNDSKTANGAASEAVGAKADSQAADSAAEMQSTSVKSPEQAGRANVSQKIIFTGQVNFETLGFEKTRTNLCDYINSIGGFQQNSSVQGGGIGFEGLKKAEYLFRIPKAKYNQAFIDLRKFGTVTFEQSSGEDVTDRYFDTEARLKSLKIQQERLQALLQKADKMEDILKIEKELQSTNYDIESNTGTLKKWDSLVEYSTLKVNINEVEQIKPVVPKEKNGLFSRITFGFKNSVKDVWEFLQNFLVFLASALPVIIPLGVIGYLVYELIRRKIKKTEVKKPEMENKEEKEKPTSNNG